jgi:hypothetical protein
MYVYGQHTIFHKPSYNSSIVIPFQVQAKGTSCIPTIPSLHYNNSSTKLAYSARTKQHPLPSITGCWHCFCFTSLHLPCYYYSRKLRSMVLGGAIPIQYVLIGIREICQTQLEMLLYSFIVALWQHVLTLSSGHHQAI